MGTVLLEYPPCSTCKKAKKWLDDRGVAYESRHIAENNPSAAELENWHKLSSLPIRRFFNTSGKLYRELDVKSKLDAGMTDAEAYSLLAQNGMLVKRPLLIVDGQPAIPGFNESNWEALLGGE